MHPSNTLPLLPAIPTETIVFLPRRQITLRTAASSFFLGLGLLAPLFAGLAALPHMLPPSELDITRERLIEAATNPGPLLALTVFLGPLIEELLYRGLLLPLLRRFTPFWFAALASSVVFAGTHFVYGPLTVTFALIVGVIFAWQVARSRSLLPSLITHMTINFSLFFILGPAFGLSVQAAGNGPLQITFPVWWLWLSSGIAAAAGIMFAKANPSKSAGF